MAVTPAAIAAQGLNQAPNGASISVLRKALDITRQQGAQIVAMMDQTAAPQTPGLGQQMDVQA